MQYFISLKLVRVYIYSVLKSGKLLLILSILKDHRGWPDDCNFINMLEMIADLLQI